MLSLKPLSVFFALMFGLFNTAQALIGGHLVDSQELKNLPVLLLLHTDDENLGWFPCTATMINSNTVLTAAHCVQDKKIRLLRTTNVQRNMVSNNLGIQVQRTQIFAHPEYNRVGHINDVAVIKFGHGIFSREHIEFPQISSGADFTQFIFYGYGVSSTSQFGDGRLRELSKSASDVKINPESASYLEVNQTDGSGICSGDSGGPVLARNSEGRLLLLAINTAATNDEGQRYCTKSGLSTRVSSVSQWLDRMSQD